MTIEKRPRARRHGEDKRRDYFSYRVKWRLGGGSGKQQGKTVDSPGDAARLEDALRVHGYPAASDPFVKTLAIIGAQQVTGPTHDALTLHDAILAHGQPGKGRKRSASTQKGYRVLANRFPLDGIGGVDIHELTLGALDLALGELEENLAPSTSYFTRNVLRTVLRANGRSDCLPELCDSERRVEPRYLSLEQVATLAAAADKHGLGDIVRLVAQIGTRWGETVGLEPKHVDVERRTLRIRQQLPPNVGPSWAPVALKTKRSRRDIPLTPESVELLRNALANRPEGPALFGRPIQSQFRNHPYWQYSAFAQRWAKVQADAGLGPIRFHDLRHTAAKQMLDAGVRMDVVSYVLGHASLAVTIGIYGGIDALSLEAVRQAFAA